METAKRTKVPKMDAREKEMMIVIVNQIVIKMLICESRAKNSSVKANVHQSKASIHQSIAHC